MERLDRLLVLFGGCSRSEAQRLIRSGAVTVGGEVCKRPETKLEPDGSRITVGARELITDRYIYIMLNKPKGVVSATKDNLDKTVLDLLPESMKRPGLFPAGRLDKDTEGLLIITDDGDFAHRMLSPKKHVEKKYTAALDGEITPEVIARFAGGITLSDGTVCRSAVLEVVPDSQNRKGIVTICEGKYHQVKRMFASCGLKVVQLQRISIGNLYLDGNLPIGSAKLLSKLDIDSIFTVKMY